MRMLRMLRGKRAALGFTLIELLIVIAIIGIIAATLIPNLIDAMQKTKQKRTVGEMNIVGTAMMSWLTDQAGAAAAGASSTIDLGDFAMIGAASLETALQPIYLQELPERDGWKTPYDYYLNVAAPQGLKVMAIHSFGRDKVAEGTVFTPGGFTPTEYDHDIVWTDGFFVRWPEKN